MKKNKLLMILGQLSQKEWKAFVQSYKKQYPRQKIAHTILDYFKQFHPNFDVEKLNADYLQKKLFSEEQYHKKVSNTLSDIRIYLHEFLLQQHLKEQDFDRYFLLAQYFKQNALPDHFHQHLSKSQKALAQRPKATMWHFLYKMQIAHESYFNPYNKTLSLDNPSIHHAMNELEYFYAAAKLRYSCELYSRQQIIQEENHEIPDLIAILDKDWDRTFHQCYQSALKMILYKKEEEYFQLKKQINTYDAVLAQEDKITLVTYLLNYAAFQIKQGNQDFHQEVFNLYKMGIPVKLFMLDNYFMEDHFINIVNMACEFGELQWLRQFIDDWKDHLKVDHRAEIVAFANASIHFREDQFKEVLKISRTANYKHIFCNLSARWLEIKSHVELNDDLEMVLNLCLACESYCRRNKLMHDNMRVGSNNFTKIIRKMITSTASAAELIAEVNQLELIYSKGWLLRKLEAVNEGASL